MGKVQDGLLLFQALDRVNLAVNSKKETKGRVKMEQRSKWVCII